MNEKICRGGYQTPDLEVVDVIVEQGFAGSEGDGGGNGSGGGYAPDSDDSEFG